MGRIRKCRRVGCDNPVPQSEGRGRPQLYCRHACKIAAFRRRHHDRKVLSCIDPSLYDRLTEIAAAYRDTGQAMSVTRLIELYIYDALLRDGYCKSHPTNAACAPEWTAAMLPYLEACPHVELVDRIRAHRGKLLREAAQYGTPTMRDPETVDAEVAEINAEL